MPKKSCYGIAFALIMLAISVSAQDTSPDNSTPPTPHRGGMPPCLRQAGVSMSVLEQLRSIAQDARSQVQNVCSDASLTPQQRRQQLGEIHRQSHLKMEDLVTPEQRKAFIACRQRRGERTNVEWFERPGGGCGGTRPAAANSSAPPNDNPQQDNAQKEDEGTSDAPPAKEAAPQSNESSPQNDSAPQKNNSPQKDESSPQSH